MKLGKVKRKKERNGGGIFLSYFWKHNTFIHAEGKFTQRTRILGAEHGAENAR